jgi:thiosulfate/3-mercaptopyruvate sulfurtransferase
VINPLVSSAWLVANHSDDTAVVDLRWYLADHDQGRREYATNHIPGAVHLDLEDDLSAADGPGRHPLPDRERFADTLGHNGISNDHHIVVYDHGPGTIAARLWWMLRWMGHANVSVLDGGYSTWTEAGYATTSDVPDMREAIFVPDAPLTRTLGRESLHKQLGAVTVLDARSAERYRGEIEPVDAAAGHIPTALSAPTTGNVYENGRFRNPAELRARFEDIGVALDTAVVSSCGSGVTACHNILALHPGRSAGTAAVSRLVVRLVRCRAPGGYRPRTGSGADLVTGK